MDFLDDEPTPEERQAALIQALKMRMGGGQQQQQPQQPQAADFYRGQGNLGLQSGDRVLGGFGQAQIQQAQQLGQMAQQGKQFGLGQAIDSRRGELQQDFTAGENTKNRLATRQNLLDELGARERLAREKDGADKKDAVSKAADNLRTQYMGHPQTKAIDEQLSVYRQIPNAPADGTGDATLVYGLAKMYDPSGRVTDADSKMAASTGGKPGELLGWVQTLEGGGSLTPKVRAQIKKEAKRIMGEKLGGHKRIQEFYGTRASKAGADPADVVAPINLDEFEPTGSGGRQSGGVDLTKAPPDRREVRDKKGKLLGYINPDGSEEAVE